MAMRSTKVVSVAVCVVIIITTASRFVAACDFGASTEPLQQCAEEIFDVSVPPHVPSGGTLICRRNGTESFFLTAFGSDIKSPDWAAYYISAEEGTSLNSGRPFGWRLDPSVPNEEQPRTSSRSASNPSGWACWGTDGGTRGFSYDRGHLAPNHIMSYSDESCGAQYSTFFITNAAMQYGDFNRGPWETLETHTYHWLEDRSAELQTPGVYVVTGAIYTNRDASSDRRCSLDTGALYDRGGSDDDGSDEFMGFPSYFFKVLCDSANKEAIAYLGTNAQDPDIEMYGMSVHFLESNYLKYSLGLESCGNAYNYSISHWDHGSWADSTSNMNMIYIPGTERPSTSSASSNTVTIAAALGAVAGVLGLIVVVVWCRSSACTSRKPGTSSSTRKSEYGVMELGYAARSPGLSL